MSNKRKSTQSNPPKKPNRLLAAAKTGQRYSGLAAAVIAVIALVVACQSNATESAAVTQAKLANTTARAALAQQTSETHAAATAAEKAYASHVTYAPAEGPRNAPDIIIRNPGDGVLTDIVMHMPIPVRCGKVTKLNCGGWVGDVYANFADVPPCDTATINLSHLFGSKTVQQIEQNIGGSDLYFMDPSGHGWERFAGTGQLLPGTPTTLKGSGFLEWDSFAELTPISSCV